MAKNCKQGLSSSLFDCNFIVCNARCYISQVSKLYYKFCFRHSNHCNHTSTQFPLVVIPSVGILKKFLYDPVIQLCPSFLVVLHFAWVFFSSMACPGPAPACHGPGLASHGPALACHGPGPAALVRVRLALVQLLWSGSGLYSALTLLPAHFGAKLDPVGATECLFVISSPSLWDVLDETGAPVLLTTR